MSASLFGKSATQASLLTNDVEAILWDANGLVANQNAPQVRQTVQTGAVTAAGLPNMLSAGTGLALNLSATASAMRTTFATGAADYSAALSADANAVVTLPALNTSYVSQDWASASSVAWGSTLAPPQYGAAYNKSGQSVLQFGGAAGSTSMLDDFGNTWTVFGGAKVQTNQFKLGTGALGGGGTNNQLNGTTDYIRCAGMSTLGIGSWSLRCWFYCTSGNSASQQIIFDAGQLTTGYGAAASVISSKMVYQLSSTGTAHDIANGVSGAATVTYNTWHFFELTYDAVAGKYFGYLDGVLDATFTSSLRIVPGVPIWGVGAAPQGAAFFTGYIDKFEYLPYCQHPNGVTYAVPTTVPNVATQGYAADFFSISAFAMYQVTGPSTVAGANPVFTQKIRAYVAQATTSAAGFTSVNNYAFNGRYDSGWFAVSVSTSYVKFHNIGVVPTVQNSWGAIDKNGNTQGSWMYYMSGAVLGGAWVCNQNPTNAALYVDLTGRFVANGTYNTATYARMVLSRGW